MATSVSPTIDTVFSALADSQRRLLVRYLSQQTHETVTVRELAAALESDPTNTEPRLHHVHLPHLDAAGHIDYDDRTGTVRYHGNEFLEDVLDCCFEDEPKS